MPLALAMTLTLTASNVQGAWVTFFCAFFPGFGIKFLVGTLLDAPCDVIERHILRNCLTLYVSHLTVMSNQ